MALACTIQPLSAFLSTNLNSKIETYDRLGDRIKRSLGYPLVSLEIHTDQLRENIQIAVEYFTKYAGFTREYLIFDSDMYEKNKGIRLDLLYTLANTNLTTSARKVAGTNPLGPGPEFIGSTPESVYVSTSTVLSGNFHTSKYPVYTGSTAVLSGSLSATFTPLTGGQNGIQQFELFDQSLVSTITSLSTVGGSAIGQTLTGVFTKTPRHTLTFQGSASNATHFQNVFDYDIMDYRKVVDVTDFEEGSTTGINTLFTLEQTLAQQTYFSYAMGNYGFDLVSWYTLKEWIDTREKMLAIRRDISFDPRTQYMQMYPQPGSDKFYGVVSCFIEKPIRNVIMEQWVYEYSLALTMITIGRVRGKFGSVNLLGGGALNYDLLQEGQQKKAELEQKLMDGASPGLGDTDPTMFFVG
jgi:hypothetical protein|tara:strand:- start:666 stop:1898 length:1233 start_codon:yes stop_codon:yes gene_type:complete